MCELKYSVNKVILVEGCWECKFLYMEGGAVGLYP